MDQVYVDSSSSDDEAFAQRRLQRLNFDQMPVTMFVEESVLISDSDSDSGRDKKVLTSQKSSPHDKNAHSSQHESFFNSDTDSEGSNTNILSVEEKVKSKHKRDLGYSSTRLKSTIPKNKNSDDSSSDGSFATAASLESDKITTDISNLKTKGHNDDIDKINFRKPLSNKRSFDQISLEEYSSSTSDKSSLSDSENNYTESSSSGYENDAEPGSFNHLSQRIFGNNILSNPFESIFDTKYIIINNKNFKVSITYSESDNYIPNISISRNIKLNEDILNLKNDFLIDKYHFPFNHDLIIPEFTKNFLDTFYSLSVSRDNPNHTILTLFIDRYFLQKSIDINQNRTKFTIIDKISLETLLNSIFFPGEMMKHISKKTKKSFKSFNYREFSNTILLSIKSLMNYQMEINIDEHNIPSDKELKLIEMWEATANSILVHFCKSIGIPDSLLVSSIVKNDAYNFDLESYIHSSYFECGIHMEHQKKDRKTYNRLKICKSEIYTNSDKPIKLDGFEYFASSQEKRKQFYGESNDKIEDILEDDQEKLVLLSNVVYLLFGRGMSKTVSYNTLIFWSTLFFKLSLDSRLYNKTSESLLYFAIMLIKSSSVNGTDIKTLKDLLDSKLDSHSYSKDEISPVSCMCYIIANRLTTFFSGQNLPILLLVKSLQMNGSLTQLEQSDIGIRPLFFSSSYANYVCDTTFKGKGGFKYSLPIKRDIFLPNSIISNIMIQCLTIKFLQCKARNIGINDSSNIELSGYSPLILKLPFKKVISVEYISLLAKSIIDSNSIWKYSMVSNDEIEKYIKPKYLKKYDVTNRGMHIIRQIEQELLDREYKAFSLFGQLLIHVFLPISYSTSIFEKDINIDSLNKNVYDHAFNENTWTFIIPELRELAETFKTSASSISTLIRSERNEIKTEMNVIFSLSNVIVGILNKFRKAPIVEKVSKKGDQRTLDSFLFKKEKPTETFLFDSLILKN